MIDIAILNKLNAPTREERIAKLKAVPVSYTHLTLPTKA